MRTFGNRYPRNDFSQGSLAGNVKETCNFATQTAIFVVNISVENTRFLTKRNNIIIGDRCRNEGAMPLAKKHFLLRCPYAYLAIALDTHADDKTVVFNEIAMKSP